MKCWLGQIFSKIFILQNHPKCQHWINKKTDWLKLWIFWKRFFSSKSKQCNVFIYIERSSKFVRSFTTAFLCDVAWFRCNAHLAYFLCVLKLCWSSSFLNFERIYCHGIEVSTLIIGTQKTDKATLLLRLANFEVLY